MPSDNPSSTVTAIPPFLARPGDRIAIAEYLGSGDIFDQALARFAETYADLNERDHAALVDAIRTGRVTAKTVA